MGEKKELMSQAHIVNQLPDVLISKVANFSCRDLINACSIFASAPEQYLTMIAVRLRPKLLLPGELLFKKVRPRVFFFTLRRPDVVIALVRAICRVSCASSNLAGAYPPCRTLLVALSLTQGVC